MLKKVFQLRSRVVWRHWALTDSRPSANVALIILRAADLAAALLEGLFEHLQGLLLDLRHCKTRVC
ncbi:MAG: hypothetical protein H8K07_08160 [Nitrospira sp.]|jgi:hypothetical protein|nr:hypothetical protein [Nitrospira sp.]MDI3467234.1 hypothetical protein [Nitrospira sp.]